MAFLRWLWDVVTVERVKALAAMIQAFGFVVGAVLAYRYARKLEQHKYDIRRAEIKFTRFHEKRLDALENISTLQGKILYEASPIFLMGTGHETPDRKEGEDREAFLRRVMCVAKLIDAKPARPEQHR